MNVLDKTIKTFADEDNNSTNKIKAISDVCSDITNVLLCRLHKDVEDADQSLTKLCIMQSELKEHLKEREKK